MSVGDATDSVAGQTALSASASFIIGLLMLLLNAILDKFTCYCFSDKKLLFIYVARQSRSSLG